jgi:hypothetical protein
MDSLFLSPPSSPPPDGKNPPLWQGTLIQNSSPLNRHFAPAQGEHLAHEGLRNPNSQHLRILSVGYGAVRDFRARRRRRVYRCENFRKREPARAYPLEPVTSPYAFPFYFVLSLPTFPPLVKGFGFRTPYGSPDSLGFHASGSIGDPQPDPSQPVDRGDHLLTRQEPPCYKNPLSVAAGAWFVSGRWSSRHGRGTWYLRSPLRRSKG